MKKWVTNGQMRPVGCFPHAYHSSHPERNAQRETALAGHKPILYVSMCICIQNCCISIPPLHVLSLPSLSTSDVLSLEAKVSRAIGASSLESLMLGPPFRWFCTLATGIAWLFDQLLRLRMSARVSDLVKPLGGASQSPVPG